MQRLKFWIGGALVALATASIAVAAQPGAKTETPSAMFRAEAKRVQTRTCQGSDGTYKITRGIYIGTMESSDARLNGRLRISVHSVYNADENAGWMHGTMHVRNENGEARALARFSAVNLEGNVEGLLTGHAGAPRAKLLANFSTSFTPEAFAAGKLGNGASTNEALLFGPGCRKPDQGSTERVKPTRGENPDRGEKPNRDGSQP